MKILKVLLTIVLSIVMLVLVGVLELLQKQEFSFREIILEISPKQ